MVWGLVVILLLIVQQIDTNIEVAGSEMAMENEFPHLVSVYVKKLGKKLHYCAGGLINSYTILLAAHCFDNIDKPTELSIQAGTIDVSSDRNGIIARVVGAKLHPKWDKKLIIDGKLINDYDIAVVYIDRNITENGHNIRYLDIDPTLNLVPSTLVDIAGWGYYKDNSYSRDFKLRRIRIPIQPADVCKDCKDELMICAGNGQGKDACHGDSGAPLVRNLNGTKSKRWSVVGLVSFGPNGCGRTGSYGVYARVARFQDWLWTVAEKPPPPLEGMSYLPNLSDDDMLDLQCYHILADEPNVCGGHGTCTQFNRCECDTGWTGVDCVTLGVAGVTVKHVSYSLVFFIVTMMWCVLACKCICVTFCCFVGCVMVRFLILRRKGSEKMFGGGFLRMESDDDSLLDDEFDEIPNEPVLVDDKMEMKEEEE